MDIVYNLENLRKYKENFVVLNPDCPIYIDPSSYKGKYIIYMIMNLKDGKRYIGSTVDFNNRVNRYIYYYFHDEPNSNPVSRAIKEEGIENFRIMPIAVIETRDKLRLAERETIIMYNCLDPKYGYNKTLPSITEKVHEYPNGGHPHYARTKANKAKFIAAVNDSEKKLVISEGMKLFADITSSSKDLVKNEAKDCRRHRGYYIIYLNSSDRNMLFTKINFKLLDVQNGVYTTPTKRGRWRVQYQCYINASNMVSTMLEEGNANNFLEEGYTCSFLHYDLSERYPYLIDPIDVFFETYDLQIFNT